jgi:hypothetical protein
MNDYYFLRHELRLRKQMIRQLLAWIETKILRYSDLVKFTYYTIYFYIGLSLIIYCCFNNTYYYNYYLLGPFFVLLKFYIIHIFILSNLCYLLDFFILFILFFQLLIFNFFKLKDIFL